MKGNYNLSSGFLFLYDWLPLLKLLTAEEFHRLFFALVDRQKNGTPIPPLNGNLVEAVAAAIEPTIKRRLDGQKGGQKTQGSAPDGDATEGTTQPSRAKRSKEKQSRAVSPSEADTLPREKRAAHAQSAWAGRQRNENFDGDSFFEAALRNSYKDCPELLEMILEADKKSSRSP